MNWTQNYNPTGYEAISTMLAALPIIVLLGTLGLFRWSAPKASAAGLATALVVAIWAFGMPRELALAATGYGACFGLFPIGWIVFAAVVFYTLPLEVRQILKNKKYVGRLSPDSRNSKVPVPVHLGAVLARRA